MKLITNSLSPIQPRFGLLSVLLMIFLAACIPGKSGGKKPDETDIARAVEATLNYELVGTMGVKETQHSQEATQLSQTEMTAGLQATLDVQAAQLTALALTATTEPISLPSVVPPQSSPAVITPLVETPPPPSGGAPAISLSGFKAIFWVRLYSGCYAPDSECWKLNDDFHTLAGETEAFLTSSDDALIGADWASPRLLFWNKRDLKYECKISLIVDGTKIDRFTISKGSVSNWRQESFDLSEYKGKRLKVQFFCPVGQRYVNRWLIQDVQIVSGSAP